MKIGDIVVVYDGSYSMSLVEGIIRPRVGYGLRNRKFRVLVMGGTYPTAGKSKFSGINNILLVDVNNQDFILFTQERFCQIVTKIDALLDSESIVKIPISRCNIEKVILTFQ